MANSRTSSHLPKFLRRPDSRGRFGDYGGRYVPETLLPALERLAKDFEKSWRDRSFKLEYARLLSEFAGRPTPLYHSERLSARLKRGQIYLKREDLNFTGSHKLNNTIGQILLAMRQGKKRIIAETGAGQHGVATATVAARFGLTCDVYMGAIDVARQAPNVERMRLLGARVIPVTAGAQTLKDATSEAIRDWVGNVEHTFYVIGSVVGPHPYPYMVREFQRIIGREALDQCRRQLKGLPDTLVACVGGGSNAIGLFTEFLPFEQVEMIGVEAGGCGLKSGRHSATLTAGTVGVLHGSMGYLLQDSQGQVQVPHSISAGLDYPGVGPEHSFLHDSGRVRYLAVTDGEALDAFEMLAREEGILPALESAHAIAALHRLTKDKSGHRVVIVCLSGRGDKDLATVMRMRHAQ